MPDFTIRGNPGAIRSRAQTTSDKGQVFYDTGDALSKIDTAGWTGRAADHFRDAHDLEPERWVKAGNGFKKAGAALLTYADAVQDAQVTADWAEGEHDRGDQVTDSAKAAYDADVADAQQKLAAGVYSSLTIIPFDDPGQAIRDNAVAEFNDAKSTLDNAAHTCAGQVRAGCADAPEEPNWLESGLKFVGGIIEGAGEAVWDLLTMFPFSPVNMISDAWKVGTGDLTPEELMKKYELSFETVEGMWNALQEDPVGFGKNVGKALLDWDTWADDPARALGHLVPDAVVAVLTAGTGAAATRGTKGTLDAFDALADMNKLDNLGDLNKLDNLADVGKFDDIPHAPGDGLSHGHPDIESWVDEVHAQHPELSTDGIRGLHDYTTNDGYTRMNSELRFPTGDPAVEARINATNQGISELPAQPGTTYRGTNLPDSVVDDIGRTGQYNDPAFSSSSHSPSVAEGFIDPSKDNPTRITV
ncbi:MAG: hypothetical protein H0X12_12805, partial [Nocardioides sp.]|nr:hypothetical protein [Nocardioides sp.]